MSKRSPAPLGATDSTVRPGEYPLGSAQSRAAARAMLEGRKADELRFEAVSILDGSRLHCDGLAEAIHAARMRARGERSELRSHS